MSTINAQNFGDGTDTVPASAVIQGTAKSWVNFNGQGTIATRDSYNVSSITDNGTGDYSLNFGDSFSNTTYLMAPGGQLDTAGGAGYSSIGFERIVSSKTTSGCRVNSGTAAGGHFDYLEVDILFVGDLA